MVLEGFEVAERGYLSFYAEDLTAGIFDMQEAATIVEVLAPQSLLS